MSKNEKIFTFRVDSYLLDYLKERADRNKRSIAKELEYIVEELYLQEHKAVNDCLEKLLEVAEKENSTVGDLKKVIKEGDVSNPLYIAAINAIKALNDANHFLF